MLDAGSGDGAIAQLVAPRAKSVTCLDRSERMLAAARTRLARLPNVRVVQGDLEDVPSGDAEFDHVLLFNVLTVRRAAGRVLAEAARVLRPGGGVTLITLDAHRTSIRPPPTATCSPASHRRRSGACSPAPGSTSTRCEVTSRERRAAALEVITAFATSPKRTA